ncbi:MAG: peptide deformylase [Chloroflexi bacterium]|nr:peptide deformylase [Chloroflexota bacterium]
MAVLPMRMLPDPILRQKAKRIRNIDASLLRLINDMIDTMQAAPGVGIAANQVGDLHRVMVIQLPDEEPIVFINPEITERSGEREVIEGCLSIPGYQGYLKRSITVKARGLDLHGKLFKVRADASTESERDALFAEALEHEIDHLNGILYIDHLESHESLHKLEPETAQVQASS